MREIRGRIVRRSPLPLLLLLLLPLILAFVGGGDGLQRTTVADAARPEPSKEPSGTLAFKAKTLTAKTFDASVRDGNVWLVEFYAPWCSHCKSFAPSYDSVAMSFHSSPEEGIRIAKVDGDTERALSSRFSIVGYPSFYLIDGYSVYEFKETRSVGNLMSFARGGYKKQQPLPWYSSPMGPVGLVQGFMIYRASVVMDALLHYRETYSLSPLAIGMLLFGMAVVSTMFLMLVFVLIVHTKEKYE